MKVWAFTRLRFIISGYLTSKGMNEGMGCQEHGAFFFLFIIIYITNFAPVCIGMVGFGRVGTLQGGSIGS